MDLKELNGEWERQLIGARFSRRLDRQMLRAHTERLVRGADFRIRESVVVSVLDKRRRIKGLAFNRPCDLILDNFGTWLASLIRAPTTGETYISLTDILNAAQTVYTYGTVSSPKGVFNYSATGPGTQLQVGSGSTPAARGNIAIQTPFATSPESTQFSTSLGSYATGAIAFSGAVTAGGSGTVNETGFFGKWSISSAAALKTFMLFHDILASGVSFSAGQIINVSYAISL